MNQPAAVYIRVSTTEQADAGRYSMENQEVDCRAKAETLGLVVASVYGDTFTGQKVERPGAVYDKSGQLIELPGMEALLQQASRYRAVVMLDRTRLGRSVEASSEIRRRLAESGAVIRYVHGDLSGDEETDFLMDKFGDVMSEMELRHFRRRSMQGHRDRVLVRKRHYGGRLPLGYLRGEDGSAQLAPEEVSVILHIGKLFLAGRSILAISEDASVRRHDGKPLDRSTVRDILSNPFYAGYLAYGWRVYEQPKFVIVGDHPPVWTGDEWEAIQRERQRRREVRSRGVSSPHIFSGIVRCLECGRRMLVSVGGGRVRYFCEVARRPRVNQSPCTNRKLISERRVRTAVAQRLRDILSGQAVALPTSQVEDTISSLQGKIDLISRREANLWLIQSSTGPSQAFYDALESLRVETESLQARLAIAMAGKDRVLTIEQRQAILQTAAGDVEALVTPPFPDVLAARARLRELVPAVWVIGGQVHHCD